MYPLSMSLSGGAGFAVANDEAEHRALTAAGYEPGLIESAASADEPAADGETVESLRAKLDALGIDYHHRAGIDKLRSLLPQ